MYFAICCNRNLIESRIQNAVFNQRILDPSYNDFWPAADQNTAIGCRASARTFLLWPALVSILPHALGTVGLLFPGKHSWTVHWLLLLYSVDENFLVRIQTSGPRIDSGHPRRSRSFDHVIMTFRIGWMRKSTKNKGLHEVWYMECSFVCHRELY